MNSKCYDSGTTRRVGVVSVIDVYLVSALLGIALIAPNLLSMFEMKIELRTTQLLDLQSTLASTTRQPHQSTMFRVWCGGESGWVDSFASLTIVARCSRLELPCGRLGQPTKTH
jgi:hypothetical protein